MQYDNRNSGVLFTNDRKTKDNQPSYTGSWTDDSGKVWNLAAWVREGRKGKFLSLKASEKREKKDDWSGPDVPPARGGGGELDDEIPF